MKATALVDVDGWLQIDIAAETPEEAGQLAMFAMNKDAASNKVANVFADEKGIRALVNLRTRRDRNFKNRSDLKTEIVAR